MDFPGGTSVKESKMHSLVRDEFPGSRRSPGEGNNTSLQYSCLENSMNRGAWQAT